MKKNKKKAQTFEGKIPEEVINHPFALTIRVSGSAIRIDKIIVVNDEDNTERTYIKKEK